MKMSEFRELSEKVQVSYRNEFQRDYDIVYGSNFSNWKV